MESGNSSPTPGQSGQEDREDDGLDDDSDLRVEHSHRPVDESNSEAVSCSREDDFEDENRPGPSSRIQLLEAEPGTSQNGLNPSRPILDSDSDSADDEADFSRYVAVSDPADGDSREAWAASSSEVTDGRSRATSNIDYHATSNTESNFSPRPSSNWNGPTPQSTTTWSISSTSASLYSVATSASSILSSSLTSRQRSTAAASSSAATYGDVSNPPSPLGEQPGTSGYQAGRQEVMQEPAPSAYGSGSSLQEPASSANNLHMRSVLEGQEPGSCSSRQSGSRQSGSRQSGINVYQEEHDQQARSSGYSSMISQDNQPSPSLYQGQYPGSGLSRYLSSLGSSFGAANQQPVPSSYSSRYQLLEPEPGSSDVASNDIDPCNYQVVGDSVHDLEPGPSGYHVAQGSLSDDEPMRYHLPADASNEPEPGPSDNPENHEEHEQADPNLLELVHGEISNPPSPLGGQVADSDMRDADSPQAGPSNYFGAAFLPDPVSNPSSPSSGPSSGSGKRRNMPPDSYASNRKRGRFEPTPGPSHPYVPHQRNNLNVSSSEAVAMSEEPLSPFQPNSPAMPRTPADNNQISSSTGFNDSVPPTPTTCDPNQVENNDLSVPSPLVTIQRINQDTDDGVDSTVDSSGCPVASRRRIQQEEEEEEMDFHCEAVNGVESLCVQSSQYNDSSAESEDEEVTVQSINVANCPSQTNSNDAISTSGQIDEQPPFLNRREAFGVGDEPVAGTWASNQVVGPSMSNHVAGSSTTNQAAGPSTSNHVAGPSTSNQVAGQSTSNHSAGQSTSNHSAGQSTSNQATGQSTSNHSAGQSTSNHTAGQSTNNPVAEPSASNSVAGPSASNHTAGSSTSYQAAGSSSATNHTAGQSTSNHTAGPSTSNNIAGPLSFNRAAVPSTYNHVTGPSSSIREAGPSTSKHALFNEVIESRPFLDDNLDLISIREQRDVNQFAQPFDPVEFPTPLARPFYKPSTNEIHNRATSYSNTVNDSPRLFGLMTERPSTSKGFSMQSEPQAPFQQENDRFESRQQACDIKATSGASNNVITFANTSNQQQLLQQQQHHHHHSLAGSSNQPQQQFETSSYQHFPTISLNHSQFSTASSNQFITTAAATHSDSAEFDRGSFAAAGNSRRSELYVVESEPSKSSPYNRPAENNLVHDDELDKGANFDDPFLPDFDPANEGNLPATFPTIDAGTSFGQHVDLEDIQVQNLGAESFVSPMHGRGSSSMGVDTLSNQIPRSNSGEDHPPFSISLAFTGIPASLSATPSAESSTLNAGASSAESAPSTSGMTGPLSKRLRTLHSLQQQKEHVSPNPKEDDESAKNSATSADNLFLSKSDESSQDLFPFPLSSSSQHPSNNHHSDDSDGDQSPFLGGTQQTFSVTIETIGTGNAIKPKKFFQQKSATDSSLSDQQPHLGEDKNFGGQNFHTFSAFVDPTSPILSEKNLQSIALSKGKRLKKSRIIWCKDCQVHYNQHCLIHPKVSMQISDHPVVSRARASLPSSYLLIKRVDRCEHGVFAKKLIPKACRFGPIEGQITSASNSTGGVQKFLLLIRSQDGSLSRLDVSDEEGSNWMRFVRPASHFSEQNTILTQESGHLYYTTTRNVSSKNELRVWYSPDYAKLFAQSHHLQLLEPSENPEMEEICDDFNSWPCFECNKRFDSSKVLQQHLNEHDDQEPSTPSKPKKSPSKGKTLPFRHLNGNSGQFVGKTLDKKNLLKKFRCHICLRNYDRQFSLQRHLALHRGEKSYKCEDCSAKFSLPFNLSRHRKKVHFVDPSGSHSRCPTCGLWFKLGSVFKLHLLSHQPKWKSHNTDENVLVQGQQNESSVVQNDAQFQCPQCNGQFETWHDLVGHCHEHGTSRLPSAVSAGDASPHEVTSDKKGKLVHKCELCYKAFASEDRLSRHMAVHGSDDAKPLSCKQCGKRFLSNSALACHLKVHSDFSNVYDCPICSTTFDQIHSLKEHVHVHRHNDIYNCPHCSKSFGEYAQIRKHIRAFHAEKKFQCSHCEKSFTGADKLKAHMVKHSDVRDYACSDCGKRFKRKDKLKEHAKRMHWGEKKQKIEVAKKEKAALKSKNVPKFVPKAVPTDYHRFIYKCHDCLLGFKRRGMLVNHLAKRHPEISPQNVPELSLPILKSTKDYFCQYCTKVYKSSSKRKVHILKNHPGAKVPPSVRDKSALAEEQDSNPTFSTTVGSVTSQPHSCSHCHKQYASNAKLLQHLRTKHQDTKRERNVAPRQNHLKFEYDPVLISEERIEYVTVDASSLQDNDVNSAPLIHLQNIYPSTSGGHRSSRNLIFRTETGPSMINGASGTSSGASLDLSEIRLGEATLVPVHSARGEMSHGLECRTVDGEILQLQLTRVPQSEALRLASSGATVIHVPADQQQHQLQHQELHANLSIEPHVLRSGSNVYNSLIQNGNFEQYPRQYQDQQQQQRQGFVSDFQEFDAQQNNAISQQENNLQIHSIQIERVERSDLEDRK